MNMMSPIRSLRVSVVVVVVVYFTVWSCMMLDECQSQDIDSVVGEEIAVEVMKKVGEVGQSGLSFDFYDESCPQLQEAVREILGGYLDADITLAAGLLRIHFHDCFVQGCDASLMLEGDDDEQTATPNLTLREEALAAINAIKEQVEELCPSIVSCADIIALVARDSVAQAMGPSYPVLLGRRDSLTFANVSVVLASLPSPTSNVSTLLTAFEAVGLDAIDLVTLSGGHTIGRAHCSSFASRLDPQDPDLDASYAAELQEICPTSNSTNFTSLDVITPNQFDNQYFEGVVTKRGLLNSDSVLNYDTRTNDTVAAFASNQSLFFKQFGISMNKMGSIAVLTGSEGEIRSTCVSPNPSSLKSVLLRSAS